MVNLLGPGAFGAARPATSRPAYTPANGAGDADDWFKDCTSQVARDGTEFKAAWLNGMLAWFRVAIRKSGVPDTNLDDSLFLRAMRRGYRYAVAGGTANALTVTLDPAPTTGEIAAGFELLVKVGTTNTGAATLNVNGVGAVAIKDPLGNALAAGAIVGNSLVRMAYDGSGWQVVPVPGGTSPILAVFTDNTSGTRTYTPTTTGWYRLEIAGAGGGGGGGVGSGCGGGGGGGGRVIDYVYLIAGTPYTYTIGAAGTGGAAGFNGTNGGSSSFVGPAGTVVATGGSTGVGANVGGGGSGGSPGSGSGQCALGSVDPGQSGFQGSPQIGQSGQGGSSPAGGFGAPVSFALSGGATAPGGAGAGGTAGNTGSAGANGRLVLQALGN